MFWFSTAAIGGTVLAALDPTESPGYEFALACALLLTPGAGHLAASLPSRVRCHLAPFPGARMPAWHLFRQGLKWSALLLAIPLGIALLNILRVPPCNLSNGLLFYLLLPTFGVLFATAVGLFLGLLIPSARLASGLWGIVWIGLAALAIHRFYAGSAVFVFGPLFGWFPGAIYDRSIEIEPTLLLYRLNTAIQIIFLLVVMEAFIDPAALQLKPGRIFGRKVPAILAVASGLLLLGFGLAENRLRFQTDSADLQVHLPRVEQVGSLYLHFPLHTPAELRRRTVEDAEFSLNQIQQFFGIRIQHPIHIYLFESIETKKQLTGSAATNIAKPWRAEIYVTVEELPHPVLRHELVHAALAPFGRGPFSVAGDLGGWIPDMGIVEGMAVSAGGPGDFSPEEWAAAMLQEGILPSPEKLMGPGFLNTDSGAAYTTVGAFFRYIRSRSGPRALLDLYGGRPFAQAIGKDPAEMESEWRNTLKTIPVSTQLRRAARFRFDRPSIIRTRCVHEVSVLLNDADRCADLGDHTSAEQIYAEAARVSGGADDVQLQHLSSLFAQRRTGDARARAEKILSGSRLGAVRESTVREWLADLQTEEGHLTEAAAAYRQLINQGLPNRIRQLAVKAHLAELASPESVAVLKVLSGIRTGNPLPETVIILRILQAVQRHPDNPILVYLLGRQFFNNGEWESALSTFQRAEKLSSQDLSMEINQELQLLMGKSAFFSRKFPEAKALFQNAQQQLAPHEGRRELLEDWIARTDYFANRK